MKLCLKKTIKERIHNGEISIDCVDDVDNSFLDDIRFGLTLRDEIIEIIPPVDISSSEPIPHNKINLSNFNPIPGKHYLGISKEKLS